jgi:hypothetical protein
VSKGRAVAAQLRAVPTDMNLTTECPSCGRKTLSAVRQSNGLVLWHCWRASCDEKGMYCDIGYVYDGPPRSRDLSGAPPEVLADPAVTVIALYGFDGTRIGEQARRHLGGGRKWVKTYPLTEGPMYDYHPPQEVCFDRLWLVEDSLSASVLSAAGEPAVALLGTSPSRELLETIRGHVCLTGTRRVLAALDPDATNLAFGMAAKFGERGIVVPLQADIKDMEHADVLQLIERAKQ